MQNGFKPILGMITGTLISRVLGLVRDMVFFGVLGSSLHASAFLFAFAVPNLFRRLWGEGALSSAFIPIFSERWIKKNAVHTWHFLNAFLSRLVLFLTFFICFASSAICLLSHWMEFSHKWSLALELTMGMLPYMLFICLAALLNATLNVLNTFKVGAFAPLILNVCMIGSLGLGYQMGFNDKWQIWTLCAGVLLGGFLQCLLPWQWLKRISEWKPKLTFGSDVDLKRVWQLLLPALFGAAVYQINAFLGRFLVFFVDEKSVSILYIANRFLELPLGLFAFAILAVILPRLSILEAKQDNEACRKVYLEGVTLLLTLLVPAAVGIYVLAKPLLQIFFEWGRFGSEEVELTKPALQAFALGLPFYGLSALITRVFHAQKDMQTPLRIATLTLGIYLLLSLLFMFPFKATGLAWASTLSVVFQTLGLYYRLCSTKKLYTLTHFQWPITRWVIASIFMGGVAYGLSESAFFIACSKAKLSSLFSLSLTVGVSGIAYISLLYFFDKKVFRLWMLLFKKS